MLYGNEFGERLKKLRKEAHLSQSQVAERSWVSKAAISNYELGERVPSADAVIKLAAFFHVSTDYLLGVEKTQNNLDIDGLTEEDILLLKHTIQVLKDKNTKNPDRK